MICFSLKIKILEENLLTLGAGWKRAEPLVMERKMKFDNPESCGTFHKFLESFILNSVSKFFIYFFDNARLLNKTTLTKTRK